MSTASYSFSTQFSASQPGSQLPGASKFCGDDVAPSMALRAQTSLACPKPKPVVMSETETCCHVRNLNLLSCPKPEPDVMSEI